MECMCAQTRPRIILSSERVLGNGARTHGVSKGKIPSTGKKLSPEEDGTHDAASSRTASPTHYQRAIPAPPLPTSYSGPVPTVKLLVCPDQGQQGAMPDLPFSGLTPHHLAMEEVGVERVGGGGGVVCWLLNVPATCKCISGTDLRRQFYVLPH